MKKLLGLLGKPPTWAVVPANEYVGSVGDSISVAGGDLAGTVRLLNTSGNVGSFFTWAMMLPTTSGLGASGKPVHGGVSAGSGEALSTIYATRWPAMRDALPKRPIVVFMALTNDLGAISPSGSLNQSALDSRIATYSTMIDEAIANGQLPVVCAVPPTGTANNRPAVLAANAALQALCAAKRVPFCDTFAPVGTLATGDWASASYHTGDGTHPSAAGARLMGQALRDTLETCLPAISTAMLVSTGDDTTGWKWLGGRFTTDAGVVGRPAGGFIALVEDTWGAPSNTATMSLVAPSGGDADGNWLRIAKTGTPLSGSSSTTGATGNAPLNTTVNDVYLSAFKLRWSGLSGLNTEVGHSLILVDSANGANTVFNFTAYGWTAADDGPFVLRCLGRKPPSASTYRWNYNVATRGASGGTGTIDIAQLSVRQLA